VAVRRLEISRVRCIRDARLDLDEHRNLIVGANGAGKTSILEAAHVLGRGHSFRVRDNRRLIQRGERGFLVRCEFSSGQRPARIGVEYSQGSLNVRIDGRSGRRASELAAALPVEVIDPASHRLVEGGPAERRRFLDFGLFHVEHGYMSAWQAYRRVLVQRNEALRRDVGDAELDVWDQAFVESARTLETIRSRFVATWSQSVAAVAERLLGGGLSVEYRGSAVGEAGLAQLLRDARTRDRERGLTMVGPHRNDLVVEFRGVRAREMASRGQQKLLVAALILGRILDRLGRGGVGGLLLVDDPVAELDDRSLGALVQELADLPVQMLVTSIRPEAMQGLRPGGTFHVEQGVIRPAWSV
jgi:DNA replication and repair protein RecF